MFPQEYDWANTKAVAAGYLNHRRFTVTKTNMLWRDTRPEKAFDISRLRPCRRPPPQLQAVRWQCGCLDAFGFDMEAFVYPKFTFWRLGSCTLAPWVPILLTQGYTGTPHGTPFESRQRFCRFGADFQTPFGVTFVTLGHFFFVILDADNELGLGKCFVDWICKEMCFPFKTACARNITHTMVFIRCLVCRKFEVSVSWGRRW